MFLTIENMTTEQKAIAAQFVHLLLCGETLDFRDFPEITQGEFESIADAVTELLEPTRH